MCCWVLQQSSTSFVNAIIDGEIVGYYKYPFYTLIRIGLPNQGFSYCGGTLVAPDMILMAASCFQDNMVSSESAAFVGVVDLNQPDQGEAEQVGLLEFLPHPQYNRTNQTGPNLMLILTQKVTKPHLQPIQLNFDPEYPKLGAGVRFVGLGRKRGNDPLSLSQQILYGYATLLSPTSCAATFANYDESSSMCADDVGYGTNGFCYGDEGGPLFDLRRNPKRLVGVIGLNIANCPTDKANIFAKVAGVTQWLTMVICSKTNYYNQDLMYLQCPSRTEQGCKKEGAFCKKKDDDCCTSEGLVCAQKKGGQRKRCLKCGTWDQLCGPGYAPCCNDFICHTTIQTGVRKCRRP